MERPPCVECLPAGGEFEWFGLVLLDHRVDDVDHLLPQSVGRFHCGSFGIDADDGFGIALAELYPLVGKVYLHTVDVRDFLVLVMFLDALQDSQDIGSRREVDAVLAM